MGSERRRNPRIRCSIPCTLQIAKSSLAGKVCNVSASGLGVTAVAPEAEQGDPVRVTLRGEGLAIEVRALVWHVRTLGRGAGENASRNFGLVLSDPAPDFALLVERLGRKQPEPTVPQRPPATPKPARPAASRPTARGAIAPARKAAENATPEPSRIREYRIRIKQNGGPRSCQIVASGASLESAVKAALNEVGEGWIVLEAVVIS